MPLRLGSDLPSFEGAVQWIDNKEFIPQSLQKKPLLVHFWAVSCYLCKQNIPIINEWTKQYGDEAFERVAVHMPRQESDTQIDAVIKAVSELGLTEPCAIDNDHKIKEAFGNDQSWVPAYFLFDAEGKLRSRTAGEAGLSMMKGTLERLLEGQNN